MEFPSIPGFSLFFLENHRHPPILNSVEAVAEHLSFYAEVPVVKPQAKERTRWDEIKEMSDLAEEYGMLVPRSVAALVIDCHPSRVDQLVKDGRFQTWTFFDKTWVCEADLQTFVNSEKLKGRPVKDRSAKQIWEEAKALAKGTSTKTKD